MASNDPEVRKAELLDHVHTAHERLQRALSTLSPEQLEAEGTVGEWSAKATLGHITWWEQVPVHTLRGESDEDLLPSEEWNTDRANAVLLARNQPRPLSEVLSDFNASYASLLRELEAMPAARLDETAPYDGSLLELSRVTRMPIMMSTPTCWPPLSTSPCRNLK